MVDMTDDHREAVKTAKNTKPHQFAMYQISGKAHKMRTILVRTENGSGRHEQSGP